MAEVIYNTYCTSTSLQVSLSSECIYCT